MRSTLTYEELCASHRWDVRPRYSIAADVCDKHPRDKAAMIWESFDGTTRELDSGELQDLANQAAHYRASAARARPRLADLKGRSRSPVDSEPFQHALARANPRRSRTAQFGLGCRRGSRRAAANSPRELGCNGRRLGASAGGARAGGRSRHRLAGARACAEIG